MNSTNFIKNLANYFVHTFLDHFWPQGTLSNSAFLSFVHSNGECFIQILFTNCTFAITSVRSQETSVKSVFKDTVSKKYMYFFLSTNIDINFTKEQPDDSACL